VRLPTLHGVQLLPEPGHGAVEVVQRQVVHTRDGVVPDPLVAGPVGAGDEEAVQDGGEDGALDIELEAAAGEQHLDHRPAAGLLPQPAKQQRAADAATGNRAGRHLGEDEAVLAVPGDGLQQAVEPATGGEQVLAAEWLEDALADAAAGFADALDEIEIAVAAGGLLDDEHGPVLRVVYAENKVISCF
jgi:hypothetical protein